MKASTCLWCPSPIPCTLLEQILPPWPCFNSNDSQPRAPVVMQRVSSSYGSQNDLQTECTIHLINVQYCGRKIKYIDSFKTVIEFPLDFLMHIFCVKSCRYVRVWGFGIVVITRFSYMKGLRSTAPCISWMRIHLPWIPPNWMSCLSDRSVFWWLHL